MTTASELGGRCILIVEDVYWIAAELARTLSRAGATIVGPVCEVGQALTLIESRRVDAAVLDVNINGVMAYPVASELERRSIPFLLATGYDPQSLPEPCRSASRIDKPFSGDVVVRALRRLLAGGEER